MLATEHPGIASDVSAVLAGYAERGVFRGFSPAVPKDGRSRAKLTWHYDRSYEVVVDPAKGTLHYPCLLPEVPAGSDMYKAFRAFIEPFATEAVPEHRRVDSAKAELKVINRRGQASIQLRVLDGDYAYATRKLTHLAQEVFLCFLWDGPYWEYRVEALGMNPDSI